MEWRPAESELQVFRAGGLYVDVVVGVVAHGVAGVHDLLEPVHVGLFQRCIGSASAHAERDIRGGQARQS